MNRFPFRSIAALLLCVAPVSAGEYTAEHAARLRYYYPVPAADPARRIACDLCVYGGTPGGVAAAVQAARMGKKAVLVEFGRHIGGLTSGGLSATDGGGKDVAGGIAREFYNAVGQADFSPGKAERAFEAMLTAAGVEVFREHRLKAVTKDGNRIVEIEMGNGNRFAATVFIDATYEGDLMAMAGVPFKTGRESNAVYQERYNGVQFGPKDNFRRAVDPYVIPGDPSTGLLPGIEASAGKTGDGDDRIQAYNFRMHLSRTEDRIPFPKPARYDDSRYALLLRYIQAGETHIAIHPGDNNNHHFFNGAASTDNIGRNYTWPTADYATREAIYQDHVTYQQGLMWFLANDPRVLPAIREKVGAYGLRNGEFEETGGWAHQLYIREARRMLSAYVMTEHDCMGKTTVEDSVGLASYQMDSHHCKRTVIDGRVQNEGQVYVTVKRPYPISYRSIVPIEKDCANLLVPVCLSASHIAYGSIRMEPVFMVVGQSAGTAASQAIDRKLSIQAVNYETLQAQLIKDGQILKWAGK